MFKLDYDTEVRFPHSRIPAPVFGPDTKSLKAYSWKIECPLKLKHLLWQIISGCLPLQNNLKQRGIKCDT